ncbi:methionine--tRNA ligase [Planctomycetota bacterium]
MTETYYLSTAIDYGNAPPHIGHAYEKICADCAARWHRMQGKDVFFLTGTDENAQKVYKAATAQGADPRTFVEATSQKFRELCRALNITNDRFIRTSEPDHIAASQHAFQTIWDKGDIYKGHYEGYYCTGCEAFYAKKDLEDGRCPTHGVTCELLKEENYFFRMGNYQDRLLDHFEKHPDFIIPTHRTNEVLNRIKEGLQDLSVSRPTVDWGIPVPTDDTHVIYVWIDALMNYLSGIGYPDDAYMHYWPADGHVIGKDIMWFHAVIWPCILMAIDVELPKHVYVHGFWHSGDAKMSKTTGNVVDPFELIETYGADSLRYFLLRETPFGQDGNFTIEALVSRLNAELANELGNLLHRTLAMLRKYYSGTVPAPAEAGSPDDELRAVAEAAPSALRQSIESYDFSVGLTEIWKLIRRANKYVEETEPWTLAKTEKNERLDTVMYNLCECVRLASVLLEPFIPTTASRIRNQLGVGERTGLFDDESAWGLTKAGTVTSPGAPLFPKVEL